MSLLDIDNNVIQTDRIINLDREKEIIIRFLRQYTQVYDTDIPIAPLSEADRLRHVYGQHYRWMCIDKVDLSPAVDVSYDSIPIARMEERVCTDVYLQLVDNQWIIVPFDYNRPVGIFNYFGDSFPDFIRFANGTSICRITTSGPSTTNYGYYVPRETED